MSALVALTLTPMLASRLLRHDAEGGRVLPRPRARAARGSRAVYARVLTLARSGTKARRSRSRVATVFGGCGVASHACRSNYFTQDDLSEVAVQREAADRHAARRDGSDAARDGGGASRSTPTCATVFATAGDELPAPAAQGAHEPCCCMPKDERDTPIETTFDEIRERVLQRCCPRARRSRSAIPAYASSSGEGYSDIAYSIAGPGPRAASRATPQQIARTNGGGPGLRATCVSPTRPGGPQITLDVDRGRAADVGVSSVALGRTLRTLLAGEKVGSFEERGERYDVRVQVLPEYRDDPSKLDLIRVRSLRGELVPITNAVVVRERERPGRDAAPEPRAHDPTVAGNMRRTRRTRKCARESSQRFAGESSASRRPTRWMPEERHESEQETAADLGFALRPRDDLDLHDPGFALQLVHAPAHDHDLGAALVHRRLLRAEARGHVARHDGRRWACWC